MSLAAEWKRAPGQPERNPHQESERRAQNARKNAQASRRRKLVFVCFITIAAVASGILIFSVFLRVMVAQNEVKVRTLEKQVELEKRQQESIKLEIASLESPARIEKIAMENLQMTRVPWAEYVQTAAYKAERLGERQRLSDKETAAGEAAQGG